MLNELSALLEWNQGRMNKQREEIFKFAMIGLNPNILSADSCYLASMLSQRCENLDMLCSSLLAGLCPDVAIAEANQPQQYRRK